MSRQSLLYNKHTIFKKRICKGVPCNEEIAQRVVKAIMDVTLQLMDYIIKK